MTSTTTTGEQSLAEWVAELTEPPAPTPRHRRDLGACFCGKPATQTERASINRDGSPIVEAACDKHSTDDPGLIYTGWDEHVTREAPTPKYRRDVDADPPPATLAERVTVALRTEQRPVPARHRYVP